MTRERPVAVLVMAILNFFFGGLGLLGAVCGGLAVLLLPILMKAMPAPPGQPNPMQDMAGMYQAIPGFIPYMIGSTVMGTVMSVLLIVAGVGLLKMRPWARQACLVYSVYSILSTLGGLVYSVAISNPAMAEWQSEYYRQIGMAAPTSPAMNNVIAVFSAVFMMAYAIALLVVMMLPSVAAAFTGKSPLLELRHADENLGDPEDLPRRRSTGLRPAEDDDDYA